MKDTPFGRITRSVRWLRFALLGILPVLLFLGLGLYWGMHRLLTEQQQKLAVDFGVMTGYVHHHEAFLTTFSQQNARLASLPDWPQETLREMPQPARPGERQWLGQEAGVHLPFSLVCAQADCDAAQAALPEVGQHLSNAYTTFWSRSPFPPGEVFLLDRNSSLAASVPGIGVESGLGRLEQAQFAAVIDTVRAHLAERGTPAGQQPVGRNVRWLRSPDLPERLIGVLPAPIPPRLWGTGREQPPDFYAATLLTLSRVGVFEWHLSEAIYDDFWLTRQGVVLDGDGTPPPAEDLGLNYTRRGWVFHFHDANGQWDAYYRVGYLSLFRDNLWLPLGAGLLLLAGIAGALGFGRWYDRRVVAPALAAQRDILDNEAFNRTIIDATPVALCVLDRASGDVVFGNGLARQWLGLAGDSSSAVSGALSRLRERLAGVEGAGLLEEFAAADGRPLHVAYSPTRYRMREVILCAFTDISAHAEIERTLARAKREADRASAAKSTFLATMSHEIRTPLYGVLGTLELLALTPLNEEQRRQLQTVQSSSAVLLQLISDILDTTRIETGQLALDAVAFHPRHLVEDAVAGYAAMARQKGLDLFACIDPDLPAWLRGDPARLRQILDNLISNAIKFTEHGRVVVRLGSETRDGIAHVVLDVEDTGVGIAPEDQARLFEPFYQVDAASHTFRGAGLGLSICMQLARLMQGDIAVDSVPGRGSRFRLSLPLTAEAGTDTYADLSGAVLRVRTPHPELTADLCRWFERWGARAAPAILPVTPADADAILVDVLPPPDSTPAWPGPRVLGADAGDATPTAVDGHHRDALAQTILALRRGEPVAPAPLRAGPIAGRLGLRVLVAEDNPINRATLAHQLEQLGCTVATADDGVQALALWRRERFDAVLTDVNMPRLNGYELAATLRREGARVPIIGVTANAMREEEQRCREAGMNAWLVKPIGLRGLWELLRAHAATAGDAGNAGNVAPPDAAEELPAQYRRLFVDTMRADAAAVTTALQRQDPATAITTLHRMRGALAMMQMDELIARFERLEDRLRAEGIVAEVVDETGAAMGELKVELVRLDHS